MNSKQHTLTKRLFLQAIELPANDVVPYINSQTEDQQVIKQVLELLETYQTNTQYTRDIVEDVAENISKSPLLFPSERYILIRKIGQGGMGDVYLAQRKIKGIKQKVAIKILQLSDSLSKKRFSQEASILSQLSHSNISQFIDADFLSDGRPYVVMEYAEGISITEYCQTNHLDIKARLSLFNSLCKAVEHAHRNLIIHRDIKPENIIVNEQGELMLLDFGIAKIIQESDNHTKTQMHAMTPAYASPEQFMGKPVSVASDVYSLGVLLFELLTDSRPYEPKNHSSIEFEKLLKSSNPTRPSLKVQQLKTKQAKWKSTLVGDLDKITLKALQFDVTLRYQTVAELLDDLNRYCNNLPVLAQTPNISYKLNKFIKRNKLVVALSIAFIIFATTFVTILFLQNESIKRKSVDLIVQRDEAQREQKKAQILSDTFVQAFENADPTKTNGKKVSAISVMEQTEKLITEKSFNDPILKSSLLISIIEVYRHLNEPNKVAQLLPIIELHYNDLDHQDKVRFMNEKAQNYLILKSEAEVISIITNAINQLGSEPKLIYTYGIILRHLSRYNEAEPLLAKQMQNLSVNDELYVPMCSIYAYVVFSNENFIKAKEIHLQCLQVAESKTKPSFLWEKSVLYFQLGRVYIHLQEYQMAQKVLEQSKQIRTKMLGENHISTTDVSIYIGKALILSGFPEKALTHIDIGLKGRIEYANQIKNTSYITKPLFNKANAFFAMEKYIKAEQIYKEIIAIRKEHNQEDSYNTASYYRGLGLTSIRLKKYMAAKIAFKRAIEIYEGDRYKDKINSSATKVVLAQLYFQLNEFEQAKQILEIAIADMKSTQIKDNPDRLLAEDLLLKVDNKM